MSVEAEVMRKALGHVNQEAINDRLLRNSGCTVVPFSTGVVKILHVSARSEAARRLDQLERSELLAGFLDALDENDELTREGMHRAFARR